jgi:hypothetical protein
MSGTKASPRTTYAAVIAQSADVRYPAVSRGWMSRFSPCQTGKAWGKAWDTHKTDYADVLYFSVFFLYFHAVLSMTLTINQT